MIQTNFALRNSSGQMCQVDPAGITIGRDVQNDIVLKIAGRVAKPCAHSCRARWTDHLRRQHKWNLGQRKPDYRSRPCWRGRRAAVRRQPFFRGTCPPVDRSPSLAERPSPTCTVKSWAQQSAAIRGTRWCRPRCRFGTGARHRNPRFVTGASHPDSGVRTPAPQTVIGTPPSAAVPPNASPDWASVFSKIAPNVVVVQNASDHSSGTGFYFDANHVLTNAHVVGSAKSVRVAHLPASGGGATEPKPRPYWRATRNLTWQCFPCRNRHPPRLHSVRYQMFA